MKKRMILLVAETGGGKNFFLSSIQELISMNVISEQDNIILSPVISYATRDMRDGEVDGTDHYFITEEEAHRLMETENVIAYTKIEDPKTGVKGYEYFATDKSIANSNIYIIDPNGINYFKSKCPEIETLIVYIHTPFWLRALRARKRSDFKKKFLPRCKNEKCQFRKFHKEKNYNVIVHNYPCLTYYNKHKLYNVFKDFLIEKER